jgi:Concanavalin A-like lectin/glucanases superfamily
MLIGKGIRLQGGKRPVAATSTILNGLVAGFPMEGNANDVVGSNNGSSTNVVFSTPNGKVNQGAGFDGTASIALTTGIATGTTFGISLWLKPTFAAGNYQSVFIDTGGNFGIFYNGNTNKINFYSGGDHFTSSTLNFNSYNHVLVNISSGALTFYVNNATAGNATVGSGTLLKFGGHGSEFLTGNLDEVYFENRIFTLTEIAALYNSGAGKTYPF